MSTIAEIKQEVVFENTQHCLDRMKERVGCNPKGAKRMLNLARERGVRYEDCRWSIDRRFLESKTDEYTEAIAYNGYCFIMEKSTQKCITVYSLPKYFGKKKVFYRNERKVFC